MMTRKIWKPTVLDRRRMRTIEMSTDSLLMFCMYHPNDAGRQSDLQYMDIIRSYHYTFAIASPLGKECESQPESLQQL